MNVQQLQETLRKEGIRDDAYNLRGGYLDESLTLSGENRHWSVYYCERGLESGKKEFETEAEACDYLLDKLRKDPTTRVNFQELTPQKLFEILRKERIREANGRWLVTWTDPPFESRETEFATEAEAREYLLNKLETPKPGDRRVDCTPDVRQRN